MKQCLSRTLLLSALLSAGLSTAHAEDSPFSISANVALTTDYVFRGYTQTDEGVAIQGGFDLTHNSGFYAGVWGSNVKFLEGSDVKAEDRADIEVDGYLGYAQELENGVSYDIGWIYYAYPGAGGDLNYDFHEFALGLGYSINDISVGLNYAYSPDFFGSVGKAHFIQLETGYEFANGIGLSAHVGRQIYSDTDDDYTVYGVAASYTVSGVDLSLNYTDTNLDNVKDVADGRVFFTIGKSF